MSSILTRVDGAVGVITIARTERFNSLDVETARDLRRAGIGFARDAKIRAVVLQGSGGIFCSGADLKYIRGGGDEKDLGYLTPSGTAPHPGFGHPLPADAGRGNSNSVNRSSNSVNRESLLPACGEKVAEGRMRGGAVSYGDVFKQILEYIHSTISEIRRAPKPFIAAVDGIAAAGGFGLAMSCDIVLASDRAWFEYAYGKTGLTGAESSTFFLPRLVGLRRAMDLLFLNPRLDAATAREWGLVSAVYPAAEFDAAVMAAATRLAALPTEAVGIAKDLMNQAAGVDRLDVHLDREIEQLARIADGENFAEGISAFFEKRTPLFK